jgi:hypothetical protein
VRVVADEPPAGRSSKELGDASAMFRRRLEGYATQWEHAAEKVRRSEYHAEDLLDDWFRLWGNALRDMTAIAALVWRAAESTRTRPNARR